MTTPSQPSTAPPTQGTAIPDLPTTRAEFLSDALRRPAQERAEHIAQYIENQAKQHASDSKQLAQKTSEQRERIARLEERLVAANDVKTPALICQGASAAIGTFGGYLLQVDKVQWVGYALIAAAVVVFVAGSIRLLSGKLPEQKT